MHSEVVVEIKNQVFIVKETFVLISVTLVLPLAPFKSLSDTPSVCEMFSSVGNDFPKAIQAFELYTILTDFFISE